jgi:ElaB/YqjD/DUF883 family membrane-anchored ribosome-binding protein
MAENKQNSENKNTATGNDNKTPAGGGATSTKQARDANSEQDTTTNPTNSAVGKDAAAPTGNVTDTAKDTFNTVKESAGAVAGEAMGQVKDKAGSVLGEQKANLASGFTSVADSIRQVGENLGNSGENNQIAALAGKYGDSLAGQIEKLSSYIEDRELRELMRDVEQFARRNPALFIGGAFTLGILAARFLKSSGGQNQTSRKRLRNDS